MDANVKIHGAYKGPLRIFVSAAVLSVMLGGCSAVPDAVNPVKWYEKTTDFFSGDRQASNVQAEPSQGQDVASNSGLAADPDAPPPAAPRQDVTQAPGGLSSDVASTNYASPPISRQGAPRDVLTASDMVASNAPPAPVAQPTVPVMSAPAPSASLASPPALSAAPAQATPRLDSAFASPPATAPKRLSFSDAPPPHDFALSQSNVDSPFGGDQFETVVITGDGMEDLSPAQPRRLSTAPAQRMAATSAPTAQFPNPGTTTSSSLPVNYGNMARVATIHFANNSSNMDARDRSILGAVIQLQKERGGRVVVIGHASSRTKDMDYIRHRMVNFEISMQRANTIGAALRSRGLGDDALEVQAVSDSQPQYLEVMPSGEVGNRRVEIYLSPS